MSQIKQSFARALTQNRGPLLSILLLAPLAMAPKGCSSGVVGDDCPATMICSTGDAGSANAGSANAGSANAGSANAGSGSGGGSPVVTCGGGRPPNCSADEYCALPIGAHCGAADEPGTCVKKPEVCDQVYAPVCGCDGKTYANECSAAAAGTSVAKTGTCGGPAPGVCGGGAQGMTCATGEFCNLPPEAKCGAADQLGTCTTPPANCTTEYAPVCGCDGMTYGNACAAAEASVSVAATGECGATGGADCGGLIGKTCAAGQYCNFPPDMACGIADGSGKCAAIPGACDTIYAPVCGCDGKTYSSECVAAAASVSVKSQGACQ